MAARDFDSGLLPESEVVKRAADSGKTMYELCGILLFTTWRPTSVAALALKQDPAKLPALYAQLGDADAGNRYWAVVGCFLLQIAPLGLDLIHERLDDESHEVRIMAAWILYRGGDKPAAQLLE